MTQTGEIISQLGHLSYVGIWGISLLANVVVPVPEEIILLAFGYLAGTGKIDGFTVIPIVISALLVSDIAMYFLAKKGSKLVTFFYKKVFSRRLESRRVFLESHIEKVIFFSRFLVQLRFLGPFMAGQTKVPFRKFITYDLAALVVYVPLYVLIGWYFRNRVEFIGEGIGTIRNIILIVVGVLLLISISRVVKRFLLGERPTTE